MKRFVLSALVILLFTNSSTFVRHDVPTGEKPTADYTPPDIKLKPIDPWFSDTESSLSVGEGKGRSLQEALNPDGTLKEGMEGSFDPSGYTMSYGSNGEPVFSAMSFGEGDERWQAMPDTKGLNEYSHVNAIAIGESGIYIGHGFYYEADPAVSIWNGKWNTLYSSIGTVLAIAVSGVNVYIAVENGFDPTGHRVLAWDGSMWNGLGTGIRNGIVFAIAVSGSNVYVGGSFTDAGGNPNADYIAVWNGSSWNALGTGLNESVRAIAVSGSNVYVGGSFTDAGGNPNADNIAVWNGSSWNALGTGLNESVSAIAVSGSNVYVGGWFTDAGGNSNADRIAVWNGSSWNALGAGINTGGVYAIAVSGSNVYVGGWFTDAGGNPNADNIAFWNGSSWNALGTGLNESVSAIAVSGSNVYVGGYFTDVGGDPNADYIAVWNGSNVHSINTGIQNGNVNAIAVSGSNVYVGGWFTDAGGNPNADYIAVWNGSSWDALGNGLNYYVNAISVSGSNVIAIYGENTIAVWDGSTWSDIELTASAITALAVSGSNVYIGALEDNGTISIGILYMYNVDSHHLNYIAELNGSIYALAVNGSNIYVGGWFTDAGGNSNADRIAVWNGSSWNALGAGINAGGVHAIVVSGSNIYVGGLFSDVGGNPNADNIAFWNGSSWNALGTGLNSRVNTLALSGSSVYVGGYFTDAGGNPNADYIAVWNGSSWNALGTGLNSSVDAIAISGGSVYVGGNFTGTSDGSVSAARIIQRNGVFPSAVLQNPEAVGPLEVKLRGSVKPGGLPGTYYFEYGITNNNLNQQTNIENMSGVDDIAVSANVTYTTPNTTVYYRLRVENAEGVVYSEIQSYTFPSEIEIRQGANTLASGSEYDFGNVDYLASSSAIGFTLHNLGLGSLTLTGTSGNYIVKSGAHPGDFTVVQSSVTSPVSYNENKPFTVQFNPQAGGVRTATLTITSNDPDEGNYVINLKGTGVKLNQTITFTALPVKTMGDAAFALSATASSGLTVNYASGTPSVATVSGNTVTLVGPGTTVITASQPGNANYNAAPNVQQTLTVRAAEPTAQPTNPAFNGITASSFTVSYTAASGSPAGYIAVRRLGGGPTTDPVDGTVYTVGSALGNGTIAYVGSGTSFDQTGLSDGSEYYYKIYSYNGEGVTINYRQTSPLQTSQSTLLSEPTTQATNISFSAPTANSLTVSWTNGNGSERLVVARQGSAVNVNPTDGNSYTGDINFSTATDLGSGNKVVYRGSGNSVTVTNLTANTVYHFRVYELNGTGSLTNYLTSTATNNPSSRTTLQTEPTAQPTALAFSNVQAASMNGSFTAASGNPTGYLVLRKAGSAPAEVPVDGTTYSGTFGTSTVVHNGSGISFSSTGLSAGTVYHYAVYAYNGSGQSINYLTANPLRGDALTKPAAPVVTLSNPTSSSFVAEWSNVPSATGYKLDVSLNNSFNPNLSGYDGKSVSGTSENVTGLQAGTQYFVRMRAVNASGESENSDTKLITTQSFQGISLSISNVTQTPQGNSTQLSVTLTGGDGARTVKFYSRGIRGNAFTETIVNSATNTYTVTVAHSELDQLGLEFYFEATDASGTASTPKNYVYRPIPANTNIPNLPFGGKVSDYRIISIPYQLSANNTPIVFSALGAYDKTKWRLLQYSGTTYSDNPGSIAVGRGYWFNSREQHTVTLGEGTVVPRNQSSPFSLSLQQGWNMIATPYPFNINWSDVLEYNGNPATVGTEYYVFNGTSYTVSNTLEPWQGGFVNADAATTLTIPVIFDGSGGRMKDIREEFTGVPGDGNWLVPLTLKQGEFENTLSAFGMHSEAEESKDRFDALSLPRFVEYIDLTTKREEYFSPYFMRDVVPLRDSYTWDFELEASGNGPVIIHWDNLALQGGRGQLILYDKSAETLVDMRAVNNYTIGSSERKLQFIYSRNELFPGLGRANLGVPHPNPFRNEVNLPAFLNLSDNPVQIMVSIRSLTGMEVYRTETIAGEKGLIQPVWKGEDESGNVVAGGVYVYQVMFKSNEEMAVSYGKVVKY